MGARWFLGWGPGWVSTLPTQAVWTAPRCGTGRNHGIGLGQLGGAAKNFLSYWDIPFLVLRPEKLGFSWGFCCLLLLEVLGFRLSQHPVWNVWDAKGSLRGLTAVLFIRLDSPASPLAGQSCFRIVCYPVSRVLLNLAGGTGRE